MVRTIQFCDATRSPSSMTMFSPERRPDGRASACLARDYRDDVGMLQLAALFKRPPLLDTDEDARI